MEIVEAMLTDTKLRNLKPQDKLYKVIDRDGLYVVTPSRLDAMTLIPHMLERSWRGSDRAGESVSDHRQKTRSKKRSSESLC